VYASYEEEKLAESEDSTMQEKVALAANQPRQRFWWFMPRAFDWLSSSLYIGIFIVAIVPAPPRVAL
jgi:hypothetical protein